jgi:uncharacterized membrane protein
MKLSVKECLTFGWRTFKARPKFFILVSFTLLAISIVSGVFQNVLTALLGKSLGGAASFIISFVIDMFMGMGVVAVYLKAHDAVMAPSLRDLWNPKPFWRYFSTYIVMCVLLLIGYVLLIVPGVILSILFSFALILVVERGLKPIDALKESARLTRDNRWEIFTLLLALLGINLLGLLALAVGLLVTIPVSTLALMHAYRTLSAATNPVPTGSGA